MVQFRVKNKFRQTTRKIKFTTYVGEFRVKLAKVSILLVEHLNLMCLCMSGSKKVAVNADGRGSPEVPKIIISFKEVLS